jgi:hypothetical protein
MGFVPLLVALAISTYAHLAEAACFQAKTALSRGGCPCTTACSIQWPSLATSTCPVVQSCPTATEKSGGWMGSTTYTDTCSSAHDVANIRFTNINASGGEVFMWRGFSHVARMVLPPRTRNHATLAISSSVSPFPPPPPLVPSRHRVPPRQHRDGHVGSLRHVPFP